MKPIKLYFPKLSMYERYQEPAVLATAHAQREVSDLNLVQVVHDNQVFPSQSYATSFWPDGSAQWILTRFLANLPANSSCEYLVRTGESAVVDCPIHISVNLNKSVRIENGALDLLLGAPGKPVFQSVSDGKFHLDATQIIGPYVIIDQTQYTALTGKDGWIIIESGPIYTAIRTVGIHVASAGASLLHFELTLSIYKGKQAFELEYRIIHCDDRPFLDISSMQIDIYPEEKVREFALAKSHYATTIMKEHERPLSFLIDQSYFDHEDIEHIPEVFAGQFFADWRSDSGGLCIYIHKAFQNYPKALAVNQNGMHVSLIPDGHDVRLYQGSAKRHRLLFLMHGNDTDYSDLDIKGLQYEMPDKPIVLSDMYVQANQFTEYLSYTGDPYVEIKVRQMAYNTRTALGMMSFGDWWDGSEWQNNEYDPVHWFMVQFARTGDRVMLEKMLAYGEHTLDVDVCHYSHDPDRMGAQIQHSAEHATGDVEVCHQWAEGLLDYYHVTGDERALKSVIGIGRNIVHLLEHRVFPRCEYGFPRQMGWALRALTAIYIQTNDHDWIVPCKKIVSRFIDWQKQYGAWLSPYTTHTRIRVPFMQSVAIRSLAFFEHAHPDEQVRNMILHEINDILNHGLTQTGLFYYKELPSLQMDALLGHIFEAVAIGYRYTGDLSYLVKVKIAFDYYVREGMNKIKSPRDFAESYPGIIAYSLALKKAGMNKTDVSFCDNIK